jgi:hypothetical protein
MGLSVGFIRVAPLGMDHDETRRVSQTRRVWTPFGRDHRTQHNSHRVRAGSVRLRRSGEPGSGYTFGPIPTVHGSI